VKYDFKVFWEHEFYGADATYQGRYDLEKDDWNADLGQQMYNFLSRQTDDKSEEFLKNFETQPTTIDADDSYMVVWDFRKYKIDMYTLQKLL
jgi:hypothetical protein